MIQDLSALLEPVAQAFDVYYIGVCATISTTKYSKVE